MENECLLCIGKPLPSNLASAVCVRCNEAVHKECFRKKYNGESAVPGLEFVCVSCTSEVDDEPGEETHSSTAKKAPQKRARKETEDETASKRPRSNSRGRPPKNDDIMKFLSDFRSELMQNMDENTTSIQQSVNAQFTALRTEIAAVKEQNADIEKSIEFMSGKYDEIQKVVDLNVKDNEATKQEIVRMNKVASASTVRLEKLEATVNRQEQAALRNNLVITGLSKTEKPMDTFWQLVSLMRVGLEKSEVASVDLLKKHESGRGNKGSATAKEAFVSDTILVRFNTNEAKGKLIKAKKDVGVAFADQVKILTAPSSTANRAAKPRVIFFRDHMTDYTMKLLEFAKNKQTEMKYKFLWSKNGQILMRATERSPVRRITTMSDLDNLPSISTQ